MLSRLYSRWSPWLLCVIVVTFPWLWWRAEQFRSDNDIETWLPQGTVVRGEYEQFKVLFGGDEAVIIGCPASAVSPDLLEAVARRIEEIPGVHKCWTAPRMQARMQELFVPPEEAAQRVHGLLTSPDRQYNGLLVQFNDDGYRHRSRVVDRIHDALRYCRLERPQISITGAPIIVTELDRLGSPEATRSFFMVSLLICLALLYYAIRSWKLSLSLLGVTLWSIYLTQSLLAWFGGQMNFIMGALSVMVMVFTLSIAVHFLNYYAAAREQGDPDPLFAALKESWNPCLLSTVTTLLGLISLNVSSIVPVSQFGYAAALGSIVALVAGLGVTPALVTFWPDYRGRQESRNGGFANWARRIDRWKKPILITAAMILLTTAWGISQLKSDIDPVDFLPRNNPVARDLHEIEARLTGISSVEAVVDFGVEDLPFTVRLARVRELHNAIAAHPAIRHALSLASFFPERMPEGTLDMAALFDRAQHYTAESSYTAEDHRFWRISARIDESADPQLVLADLHRITQGAPIHFTGLSPLLENAQNEIFDGFWKSFLAALISIFLVMIISLRSFRAGLIAMAPNVAPIWLVFGMVGFFNMPVDIGMMMTGSIALGISVDCTFHFLVKFRSSVKRGQSSGEACAEAMEHTGAPLVESTFICAIGMLALCLSNFLPTVRFGYLMAAQMTASLLGELVLLPALLCLHRTRRVQPAAKGTEGTSISTGEAYDSDSDSDSRRIAC